VSPIGKYLAYVVSVLSSDTVITCVLTSQLTISPEILRPFLKFWHIVITCVLTSQLKISPEILSPFLKFWYIVWSLCQNLRNGRRISGDILSWEVSTHVITMYQNFRNGHRISGDIFSWEVSTHVITMYQNFRNGLRISGDILSCEVSTHVINVHFLSSDTVITWVLTSQLKISPEILRPFLKFWHSDHMGTYFSAEDITRNPTSIS
jgi:hypothetical protein